MNQKLLQAVDKAKTIIKDFEGLELKAYKKPNDPWTIGYGHTKTARPGMVITSLEAENLLMLDLMPFARKVADQFPQLNANQMAAIISFSFNVGTAWFNKNTGKALAGGIETGNFSDFKKWFLKWIEKGSIFEKGLIRRRKAELELFFCPTG